MANVSYALKREPDKEKDKIAKTPQVAVVLKHLQHVGVGHKISREDLAAKVDADKDFVSRQGAAKILNFYIPKLVKEGLVEKFSVEEPKEAKPAKASKPKASEAPLDEDEAEDEEDLEDA